jgi:hypothetical protein
VFLFFGKFYFQLIESNNFFNLIIYEMAFHFIQPAEFAGNQMQTQIKLFLKTQRCILLFVDEKSGLITSDHHLHHQVLYPV